MADLVKKVKLEILADDAEAQAKIDAITAKADRLRALNPEITPKVNDFEAKAKLDVLRAELKDSAKLDIKVHVDDRSLAESEAKIGIFKRLLSGGSGKGGGGLLGGLASAGDAIPFTPGGIPGLAVAIAGVATLLPELTALASGFAAAGAGAGAFGLLALPTFDKIKNAYTGISTAQTNYNNALALEKADPTKSHAAAVALALVKLKIAQDNLPASTKTAIASIDKLKTTYEKMAKAFQPVVMKVFNDGLKVANNLLPTLKTPANDFGNAIGGLLQQLGKFTQSKGFADWLKSFDKIIGPATTAIGHGVGQLVISIGKLFTVMSKKDIVNGINIAFAILSGTIRIITGTVKVLMEAWDQTSKGVVGAWHLIRTATLGAWHVIEGVVHNIEHAWDNVVHAGDVMSSGIARVGKDIGGFFTRMWSSISHGITTGVGWFRALPGRILSALGNLGKLLFNAGANIIRGLIGGIESMFGSVKNAIGGVVQTIRNFLPFSPARTGPLSGPGSPDIAGRKIGQMLAQGISGSKGAVTASAGQLARAAGISAAGGGAAGGGAEFVFRFEPSGNALTDAIGNQLKGFVRRKGGGGPKSAQIAFGQTA